MKRLKRLVILLNLDIFGESYHLFPSNQHSQTMLRLLEQFGGDSPEAEAFAGDIKHRESIRYLDRMLEECRKLEIENLYIFLPVNHKIGELYFEKRFYEKYDAIRDAIAQHIANANGRLADFSYTLDDNDFIRLRSSNEGLRENGRIKLATEIRKFIST